MSTGYSWEGIRQVRATLRGAHHVPERLCGGYVYLGRYIKCLTFTFFYRRRAATAAARHSLSVYRSLLARHSIAYY